MKTNKFKDERIQKNMEQIATPMYPVFMILTTAVLAIKIVLKLHPLLYLFEIIALISSPTYYTISTARKGVLFTKRTDEAIINIRRTTTYHCYELHLFITIVQLLFNSIAYYFYQWVIDAQAIFVVITPFIYILIWTIPFSIAGNKMKKQGDLHSMLWSSEKSKTYALKGLKKFVVLNFIFQSVFAIVFGLLTNSSFNLLFHLVWMNFLWIFIYFIIRRNLLDSEKKAKELEFAERTIATEDDECVK
jgi:hypothetical protein